MRVPTQEDCRRLVDREVNTCVSSLVSTLANGAHCGNDNRELTALCEQASELSYPLTDYEEAARDHIRNGMNADELQEYCEENDITACAVTDDASEESRKVFVEAMRKAIADHLEAGDDSAWQSFCEDMRVEPYDREIYEHWCVSDWLARKLEARGEKVDLDFAGLTVWARTCTGQAICLDCVIADIAREMLNA